MADYIIPFDRDSERIFTKAFRVNPRMFLCPVSTSIKNRQCMDVAQFDDWLTRNLGDHMGRKTSTRVFLEQKFGKQVLDAVEELCDLKEDDLVEHLQEASYETKARD